MKTGTNKSTRILFAFWLVSFLYFLWFGRSIFIYQYERSLFLLSTDYFADFLVKPGGLLEYAGRFLTESYIYPWAGALMVSMIFILFCILLVMISRQIIPGIPISFPLLLPALFLVFLQKDPGHFMHFNLGFLLAAGVFCFYLSAGPKARKMLTVILFPALFYLAGSFAFIFAGLFIVHILFYEADKQKAVFFMAFCLTVALTLFCFSEILTFRTINQLLFYPAVFSSLVVADMKLFVFAVLLPFTPFYLTIIHNAQSYLDNKGIAYPVAIVLTGIILFFFRPVNSRFEKIVQMEEAVAENDWGYIIEQQETRPVKDLKSLYCYNLALSNQDQLCSRLFNVEQYYGPESLTLPHDNRHINMAVYFYYSIGLINQAHHLAYESMVRFGYLPGNLKLLAKTNLINGNFRLADKYIAVLENTFRYKELAEKYGKIISDPALISNNAELAEKIRLQPETDFFIREDDNQNIELFIDSNPHNKRVFEYKMARLLLEKDHITLAYEIKNMESRGYTFIPRHMEEAIMVFFSERERLPEMGGMTVSRETMNDWMEFSADAGVFNEDTAVFNAEAGVFNEDTALFSPDTAVLNDKQSPTIKEGMKEKWGNTYWYYYFSKTP